MPHTITPHIVVRDAARAADWYTAALGAEVRTRVPVPNGKFIQIELCFGDSAVMIADEFPELGVASPLTLGGTYGALSLLTEDVDAVWQKAVDAGASVHQPLQETFWGERYGQIIDPFGHRWGLAQHVRDVPIEDVVRSAQAVFSGTTKG